MDPVRTEPVKAEPPPPPAPELVELEIPTASVIGLQIETPVSTERARVEDRVEARVMRDVAVDGRTADPAGTRALGAVTLVERGGKLKERARLGVRFHTLVLADGTQLPIRTDAIIREGESQGGDSARKIGGAAVGGAILGALIGGKKGAVIGGATGAAGGTAIAATGERSAARPWWRPCRFASWRGGQRRPCPRRLSRWTRRQTWPACGSRSGSPCYGGAASRSSCCA